MKTSLSGNQRSWRTFDFNPIGLLLAPLATVSLLLMFFLLLCTSLVLQPGIAVQVPSSSFLLPPQHEPLVVSVTGPPLPSIFFENQRGDVEKLGVWLDSQQNRTRTVIIKSDQYAPAGIVTEVLNQALRHGYSTILATQEKSVSK